MRPFHAGSQDDNLFGTRPADGRLTPANPMKRPANELGGTTVKLPRRKILDLAARPAG